MLVQITTGAAQLILGSILPGLGAVRWAKTPHRKAHEALATSNALMEKRMSSMYDYLIPPRIKEIDKRDTPDI